MEGQGHHHAQGHHDHDHGHHHHGHGHGATELNKEYFDEQAKTYDEKHAKTLGQLIEEIRKRVEFIGVDWVDEDESETEDEDEEKKKAKDEKRVRLLDYACGTGVVSRALAPYTTQCVGIDLSEGMAAAYNARAENQGLSPSEMHAYQGNLCDPTDPNPSTFDKPEFQDFDVAAIGLGLHHFDNPPLAIQRIASRLKKGGVLIVIEFLTHEKPETDHPAIATVTHHGFSESQMKKMYQDAGVAEGFALQEVSDVVFNKGGSQAEFKRRVFIARGSKA
ncbi:S-adenosyl-L-methionine-dependent methyltransferase [Podospora fimiseda]|uniref:S-adenosyl-L-methionine-dependent methyltransferase n=1 Tax=Podospora fimiseda TaxID=252190 RepID=A0AAN6YQP5_9PEZI|nr:S-adenosyl-L-methionine-dependent methyltransferase [Podospora fimiseda]